jgi:nucleoside-diphosphate-sugar epimerase
VYDGLSFYTGGSNGFVDVRDVVEVMMRLMESSISGERFILSSENVSIRDFLFMIADELKVKRPAYKVTKTMGELAWRYEGLKALLLNREADFVKDDIRIARIPFKYSNAKVIGATGYKFRSVAESIHDTAQSFLASKKKGLDFATFE